MDDTGTTDDELGSHAQLLRQVGFDDADRRAATGLIVDHHVAATTSPHPGVEVLPLSDALRRHRWLQDLMFHLIEPDENETVRQATELIHDPVGCFVWVKEGAQVDEPIQRFSVLDTPQGRQFTHNITVIDANASVRMVNGAAAPDVVHAGHHVSIDECYVRQGATCTSLSIEHWGPNMESESYTRTRVEAGAQLSSTTISLAPIAHHRSHARSWVGADAVCNDHAIALAPRGTTRILDSETILEGRGAASESRLRMVSSGGVIHNNSLLVGEAPDTRGFLGCDGLKLTDAGEIESVPALRALSDRAQLSHEASVGMISRERLEYLMATGLDEEAAGDLIVKGFLQIDEHDLPPAVEDGVVAAIAAARSGSM